MRLEYRELAVAVVLRAMDDLTGSRSQCKCKARWRCLHCRRQDDARRFFVDPARSDVWMDAAGVDGDQARLALAARGLIPEAV